MNQSTRRIFERDEEHKRITWLKQGRKEGWAEGRSGGRAEVAARLLASSMSPDGVARFADLSIAEIEKRLTSS